MAKNYKIEKSKTTGWWVWTCKGGSGGGSSTSKKEAKAQGKANCPSGEIILTPPKYDADFTDGQLNSFSVANLDNLIQTFSPTQIDEEMFEFFFGLNCEPYLDYDEAERLITIFKIWGVYLKGGTAKPDLKSLYNLTEIDFQKLIIKDYIDVEIFIDDFDNFTWTFPV
jgi:hypothetical protein